MAERPDKEDVERLSSDEAAVLFERLFPQGFAGRDVREELSSLSDDLDLGETVGLCLWDIFSDNHDVLTAEGALVDLGSWRAAGEVLADCLNRQEESARYDYLDFYMGSMGFGRREEGAAVLAAVYRMIFRRLKAHGLDWVYSFPRLYLIDLAPLARADESREEEPDWSGYSPSDAIARETEDRERRREIDRTREELDECHREAVEEARRRPPPETVKAYQAVFGRLPQGWPPEA